jgi:hypothetical protein
VVETVSAETASTQAFSPGVQADAQRNTQSSSQAPAIVQATEPLLISTGSLDPLVSPQVALPSQPPLQTNATKDEDDPRLLVDDAMTQTGLW